MICRACTRLCLACVPVSIFLARVIYSAVTVGLCDDESAWHAKLAGSWQFQRAQFSTHFNAGDPACQFRRSAVLPATMLHGPAVICTLSSVKLALSLTEAAALFFFFICRSSAVTSSCGASFDFAGGFLSHRSSSQIKTAGVCEISSCCDMYRISSEVEV